MATVTFQFGLPSSIYDTAGPDDWDGTISLGGDVSSVSTVSLVGSGASYFSVSYDAQFGVATLHPVAAEKYENFAAGSYVPGKVTFDVALSVTFADGTTQVSPTDGHVSLVAVDDDPPVNLHFSAGGTLAEGQAGAVIGTLLAEDHDPAFSGTLYYALGNPAADSAYEVDGNVLRLKDDASVSGAPGTTHSVAILVSDGPAAMV